MLRALILLLILPLQLLAQQGSSCETAIAADAPGFTFPAKTAANTWYKFSAKELRLKLVIPKDASFLLFEDEGNNFCNSLKSSSPAYTVLARRGAAVKTTGIKLPGFTVEELNGKCACDFCTGDPYAGELWLKKEATYYLMMLSQTEGIKMEFINVPETDATVTSVLIDPKPVSTQPQVAQKLKDLKAGEKATLNNIMFYPGTASLLPGAESDLDALLQFMQSNKTVKIEIQGHINGYPSEDPNDQLSWARAKVVYEHLVSNGIEKERLTYKGFGTTKLIYNGPDPARQQLNRRVEVLILSR
jgi:outer membrane protein OmpA-like peptidoglycan-associated protein